MTDEEMNQMTQEEELIALAKQQPLPQEPCFISEEEEGVLQDPPSWARICFAPKSKMEDADRGN